MWAWQSGTRAAPGFFHSVRCVLAALHRTLHTRLELFVTELEEERERLRQAFVLALLLFFGASLGFILLNIFLVALFWQAGWVYAIGALALLYLAVGVGAGLTLRKRLLLRSRLFAATLGELAKDRERWRSAADE